MPRMRTVKQAIQEIKASDANTAFTEKALRRMIFDGQIPTVSVGRKTLINMDLLLAKLSGESYNDSVICVS